MRLGRSVVVAGGAVFAMLAGSVQGAAASGPLFDAPGAIDSGVAGTWMPGFPVRDLDRAGGLDLAVIGCENSQNAMAPAPPNTFACPAPQATMSIVLGDGAGNFRVAQRIHAGSYPTDVTSGYLNNDRRLDLAVTDPFGPQSTADGEVLLYEQLAQAEDGDLFRLRKVVTLAGPQPKGVQAADVNRDGAEDLVVLQSDPAGPDIQVLLGDREGNFDLRPRPAFGSCTSAHFFKGFSDFNEDGKLDFAVPCNGDAKVAVMLGNGDGTFAQTDIALPGTSMNVAAADFNADGNADFAVSARRMGGADVAVFLGTGTGTFNPGPGGGRYSVGYASGNLFTTFLDIADFAGPAGTAPDGILDVAVSNSAVNFTNSSISILTGQGDGSLVNAATYGSPIALGAGTGFRTWGLVSADYNGDAKLDLAVAGGSPTSVPGKLTLLMSPIAPAQTPPAAQTPAPPPPPPPPAAGKLRTTLTLSATPRRDLRLPFRYTFRGRLGLPAGTNRAAVCGGKVTLRLRKGLRTVARGSVRLSKSCSYQKRVSIFNTKLIGRKRGTLTVTAAFGGTAALKSSRKTTTVGYR